MLKTSSNVIDVEQGLRMYALRMYSKKLEEINLLIRL